MAKGTNAARSVVGVVLVGVLGGCSGGGEPSSGDLAKVLVEQKLDLAKVGVLGGCLGALGGLAMLGSKVTRAEKNECVKANGKPGYVCTFVFDIQPERGGEPAKGSKCEARFVKWGDGTWSMTVGS